MNCPTCVSTELVISDRQGIEIDYCPRCRGVWLDRGELDKIIERSVPAASRGVCDSRDDSRSRSRRSDDGDREPKKREGFLSELFDFDLFD